MRKALEQAKLQAFKSKGVETWKTNKQYLLIHVLYMLMRMDQNCSNSGEYDPQF